MIEPAVKKLERTTHPGWLGLRFWDVGAAVPVQDGLRVRARTRNQFVEAVVNRSGVWHFPELPGINAARIADELSNGRPLASLARLFTITVESAAFHAARFELFAPVDGGLFDWPYGGTGSDGSPPVANGLVPLFSAASRVAPPALLTVRASLWDVERERPASWALLEITVPGSDGLEQFLGLSDERGAVVVFLPVPFVPVDGTRMPLSERTWNAAVRVFYAPWLTLLDSLPASGSLPALDSILAQRDAPAATAFARRMPDVELASATLRSTETLLLKTAPDGLEAPLTSYLLVRSNP